MPLARLTTLGHGWAGALRSPGRRRRRARRGARAGRVSGGLGVATVGLGSNLLVADEGVDALVLEAGGRARPMVSVEDRAVRAGGGATNAVVLHRARAAALGGFEFACAIPGTTGGGVWMNAGAYGGDFSQVLERALVVDADRGARWLTPSGARAELPALGASARAGRRARSSSGWSRVRPMRSRRPSRSCRRSGRRRSRRTSGPSGAFSRTPTTS